MYGGGEPIIPKKLNPIDQDQNKKKKKNKEKNRLKEQKEIAQLEEQFRKVEAIKNQQKQTKKVNDKLVTSLNHLIKIFPQHKPSTLQKVLKDNNNDLQQAISYIADYVPSDSIKQPSPQKKQQIANQILNEFIDYDSYGQTLDINDKQFQQLFQQVSNLIKNDQTQKKVDIIQINEFLDECQEVKRLIIVGFHQYMIEDQEMRYTIDQVDPIVIGQTQQFLEKVIIQNSKEEKIKLQQFPSLKQNNVKSPRDNYNVVDKITLNNKSLSSKQPTYNFKPQGAIIRQIPTFNKSNQHSIYNIDNRYQSQSAMRQLSKEYNNVNLPILRFIYKQFDGNFNMCKAFLEKYYKDKKTVSTKITLKKQEKIPAIIKPPIIKIDAKQYLDQDLMKLSLGQIRKQLDHLFKIRQVFKMTRNKIKNAKNKKQLQRLANQNLPLINKMSKVSRYKLVQQCRNNNPLKVDLHGYREDQVDLILMELIQMIKQQVANGNNKIKKYLGKNGRQQVVLSIITGYGHHSTVYGQSVLKPAIQRWCNQQSYKVGINDVSVEIFISV